MKHIGNKSEREGQPTPWIEREGIRMYGEPGNKVELKDLESLEVTTGSLLHVMRHLTDVSPHAREQLVGRDHVDGGKELVVASRENFYRDLRI